MAETVEQKACPNGWKRLCIVLAALWSLACLFMAVWSAIAWYGGGKHPFQIQDIASFTLALVLFLAVPVVVTLGAGRFFRFAVGYQGKLRDLSIPRMIWVVLAFFLAWSFLLPGWLGLAVGAHSQAAQAMGAWQILGQPKPDAYALAFIFLPQWALYALGSWVLMRIVDWIGQGFSKHGG